MTPIFIDVEASGFGRGGYPIEVGLVLPDGNAHCFLISPQRSWTYWDPEAEKVHGISRETLINYGRNVEDVAWRMNELLGRKTVYSDAWSFDMSWLGKLYDEAGMVQTFEVASLRDLMSDSQIANWDVVKESVTTELSLQRHRASGDARILQQTYLRVAA